MYRTYRSSVICTVLDCVLLLLLSACVSFLSVRCSISTEKTVGLSDYSYTVCNSVTDLLRISYYVSSDLENTSAGIQAVDAKLCEYAWQSRFITYEKRNPESTAYSGSAASLGLIPRQIETTRGNKTEMATVYSGISFEYRGKILVLPVIYDTVNLEYEVTSAIVRLVSGKTYTAGIITAVSPDEQEKLFLPVVQWLLLHGIESQFLTADMDYEAYDLLFIFGDHHLAGDATEAVLRFRSIGKPLLVAVPPSDISLYSNWICDPVAVHPLAPMLAAVGITVGDSMVLDASNVRLTIASPDGTGAAYVQYPLWPQITPSGLNRSHPVTAVLNGLTCFWPGRLNIGQCHDYIVTPIVQSGLQSYLMMPPFNTNPYDSHSSISLDAEYGQYCIAATVQDFEGDGRMIVIADSLFASAAIELSQSTYNLDFLLNASDWLLQNDALLALKKNGSGIPLLECNLTDSDDVNAAFMATIWCIVIIPLILIVISIGIALYHRRRYK